VPLPLANNAGFAAWFSDLRAVRHAALTLYNITPRMVIYHTSRRSSTLLRSRR